MPTTAGKLGGSSRTSCRPSRTSQLRSLLQRTSTRGLSPCYRVAFICIRELATGLSCTGPAHSPTSPLPPSSCMLHQRGITPGSGVEPVKVLPEGSAPTTVQCLQLPSRQQGQQMASLHDLLLVRAARGGSEEF